MTNQTENVVSPEQLLNVVAAYQCVPERVLQDLRKARNDEERKKATSAKRILITLLRDYYKMNWRDIASVAFDAPNTQARASKMYKERLDDEVTRADWIFTQVVANHVVLKNPDIWKSIAEIYKAYEDYTDAARKNQNVEAYIANILKAVESSYKTTTR